MRPSVGPVLNQWGNAFVSAWVANLLSPGESIHAAGTFVIGDRGSVDVSKGCEGVEVVLILTAAMLAYPMSWRRRLLGVATGVLFVYVINLVRIVGLFLVICSRAEWFDTAHVGVGQGIVVLLAVCFFMAWIDRAPRSPGSPSAANPRDVETAA